MKRLIELDQADNYGSAFVDVDSIISVVDMEEGRCVVTYGHVNRLMHITTSESARSVMRQMAGTPDLVQFEAGIVNPCDNT